MRFDVSVCEIHENARSDIKLFLDEPSIKTTNKQWTM
jgi:hypothetical protein